MYSQIVESYGKKFDSYGIKKMAVDLATILDNPIFSHEGITDYWTGSELIEGRQKVFNAFCAICLKAVVPLPDVEEAYYRFYLPKPSDDKPDELIKQRFGQLEKKGRGKNKKNAKVEILRRFLSLFPSMILEEKNEQLKSKVILAVLNMELIGMGEQPLRQGYDDSCLPKMREHLNSFKKIQVVIIDDRLDEILNTMFQMIGWPNVTFVPIHYQEQKWKTQYGVDIEARAQALCERIISHQPDIILIDKDLSDSWETEAVRLTGPKLVPYLRNHFPTAYLLGNTGGTMDDFHNVDVLENCQKGRNLDPILHAIRRHNR